MKKKKNKWITPVLIVSSLILMLLLLNCSGKINIEVSNKGHGEIHKDFISSLGQSLGIIEDYDYTDEEGNNYCFNNDCWDRVNEEYEECLGGELMFSPPDYYHYFELIPSACAIGIDPLEEACEEEYFDSLMAECTERCEEEIYIWDGTPINNLKDFSETAFPNFIEQAESSCTFLAFMGFGGTWVSQPNKIGCTDCMWISTCSSDSLTSAGEVCETIGKDWTCGDNQAFCSD